MICLTENGSVVGKLPEGGILISDFINGKQSDEIIDFIDSRPWGGNGIDPNPELRRRTQHYGFLFSYRLRKVVERLCEMPLILSSICRQIEQLADVSATQTFNSVIVNEYLLGQGIMPHTDSPVLFGSVIASVSLLSDCIMTFEADPASPNFPNLDSSVQYRVVLPKGSLLVMTGSCRYDYKHSISKLSEETCVRGQKIVRSRRVSLTFRHIVSEAQP